MTKTRAPFGMTHVQALVCSQALAQFIDNQIEVDDESDWPDSVRAEVAHAREMRDALDAYFCGLAQ